MLSSIVTGDVGWTPAQLIPDLWIEPRRGGLYQSSAGTTAAKTDADVVGFVPDLSHTGFNLASAADDTTRPTINGIGAGAPYLSFDGSNDILIRAASLGSYAANACSVFAALRSNSNATSSIVTAEGDSGSNNSIYTLLAANSSTASVESCLIRNSSNSTMLSSATSIQTGVFDGNDHVFGILDDGTNSAVTPYLDGVAGASVAYALARPQTLVQNRFALGGLQRAAAGSWWAGRVYGLVIVNRLLTPVERSRLTTYLGRLQRRVI